MEEGADLRSVNMLDCTWHSDGRGTRDRAAEAWHSDKLLGLTYLHPQPLSLQSKLRPAAI